MNELLIGGRPATAAEARAYADELETRQAAEPWKPKVGEQTWLISTSGKLCEPEFSDDWNPEFAQGNIAPYTPEGKAWLEGVARLRAAHSESLNWKPKNGDECHYWWPGVGASSFTWVGSASNRRGRNLVILRPTRELAEADAVLEPDLVRERPW